MDREIPKGKADLYVLGAAYKWHPYAERTLPVTSQLLHVCGGGVCVLILLKKNKKEGCENVVFKLVLAEGIISHQIVQICHMSRVLNSVSLLTTILQASGS